MRSDSDSHTQKTLVLLNVNTMWVPPGNKINVQLIDALKESGINDVCFFTDEGLSVDSMNAEERARYLDIISAFVDKDIEIHAVVTPIDPVYRKTPGLVWSELLQWQLLGGKYVIENQIAKFQWDYHRILMDWINATLSSQLDDKKIDELAKKFNSLAENILSALDNNPGFSGSEAQMLVVFQTLCVKNSDKIKSPHPSHDYEWMQDLPPSLTGWTPKSSMYACTLSSSLAEKFDRYILLDANVSDVKTIDKYKSALCEKTLDCVVIDPTLADFKGAYKEQLNKGVPRKINTEDMTQKVDASKPEKISAHTELKSLSDMNIFMTALTAFIHQIQAMMNKIRSLNKASVFAKPKGKESSRDSTQLSPKRDTKL